MKKLFFSLIISLMILFIIWFIAGWVEHGSDIFNKHLDLFATLKQINGINFNGYGNQTLLDVIKWGRDIILKVNQNGLLANVVGQAYGGGEITGGLGVFLNAIEGLVMPIKAIANSLIVIIVLIAIIIMIMYVFMNFTISIVEVLLSPVFI